ncbi:MAG TPA: hypothetical protein VIK74_02945, partial [Parasegetibacter sp.]
MKLQLSLALILFWGTNLIAQNKAILSGKLNPESNLTEISIRDIDGVVVAAPVKEDGSFMLSTDKLLKGFYEISDMGTVYLKPGFSLVTSYDGKQYKFSGNGAVENNALIQARADLNKFFPLDEKNQPLQETYYLDVPVFLEKMQSFYEHGEKLFSQSSDAFFKEFALLDLKFVGREMTWLYSLYYGKDLKKMEAFHDLIQNADREDPGFSKKLDSAYRATNVKQIDSVSLKNLQAFLYESWDKNNEVLFKNSSAYRRGI